MWRSVFLAIGITLCLLGGECLVVEEAVLAKTLAVRTFSPEDVYAAALPPQFKTREWMPWTFLSTGAVIILYSITLPKRFQ